LIFQWGGNQSKILKMTDAAGNSPTEQQFFDAKNAVDDMMGGDSSRALGAIMQMRDSGTENPLLACLDHYYNSRDSVESSWVPGLIFAKVLAANAIYSGLKAVGGDVPQDTNLPASPQTELQWMAGNWGAVDGVMPCKKSSK